MKHLPLITVVILHIFVAYKASAQIEVPTDSATNIGIKGYGGVLSTSFSPLDTVNIGINNFGKIGGQIYWEPLPFVGIGGYTYTDIFYNSGESRPTFNADGELGVKLSIPNDRLEVQFGYIQTVSGAIHRPHSLTEIGQFEPRTPGQIPGSKPGFRVEGSTERFSFFWGMGYETLALGSNGNKKDQRLENHLGLKAQISDETELTVSGWYGSFRYHGAAVTFSHKQLFTTAMWNEGEVNAVSIYNLPKDMLVYADMGYDYRYSELVRAEAGLIKKVDWDTFGALIGVGYAHKNSPSLVNKQVKVYLFIYGDKILPSP